MSAERMFVVTSVDVCAGCPLRESGEEGVDCFRGYSQYREVAARISGLKTGGFRPKCLNGENVAYSLYDLERDTKGSSHNVSVVVRFLRDKIDITEGLDR